MILSETLAFAITKADIYIYISILEEDVKGFWLNPVIIIYWQ